MLNGKKIAYDEALGRRIVSLREGGYTWRQIDQLLFPGEKHKDQRCGSFAGDFCIKYRKQYAFLEGAFSKQLIGGFGPTQIVVPLRRFNPFASAQKAPEHTRITMADLGL